MKAITLYEPWATMMAIGAKQNETRPHWTRLRGEVAIHAAKAREPISETTEAVVLRAFKSRKMEIQFSYGCIVCVLELWDVVPTADFVPEGHTPHPIVTVTDEEYLLGNYSFGRFGYRTRNLRRLKTPVPCRGYQAIGWNIPPVVEAQIRRQL